MTMADEYAAYGVPCLHPPCKVSKLKIAKEETDQGSDEVAIESQFLQHKTKGNKLRKILGNIAINDNSYYASDRLHPICIA